MKKCTRINCFSNKNGNCTALKESIANNCSFFKTKEEINSVEKKSAKKRKEHLLNKLNNGETVSCLDAAFLLSISVKNFYHYLNISKIKSKNISNRDLKILKDEIENHLKEPVKDDVTVCCKSDCVQNENNHCKLLSEVDNDSDCVFYKTIEQYAQSKLESEKKLKRKFQEANGLRLAEKILTKYEATADVMPIETTLAKEYGRGWHFEKPKPKYF